MENKDIERLVRDFENSSNEFIKSLNTLHKYINKFGNPSKEYQERCLKAAEKIDNYY